MRKKKMNLMKTYACYLKDDEIRMSSSSGAVFSALAFYVLSKNGIVYGVAMSDDCYSAEFVSVSNKKDLKRLMRSKYLQAKVGDSYKNIKDDLETGKTVLFTGTGCQINGLKSFLGREYDNLLCVDVICHGVPSPVLWRKYAKFQEKENGGKLKYINFRCKDKGWIDFGLEEVIQGIPAGEMKKSFISQECDPYMQMFLRDYSLRPSCYKCKVKDIKLSDITIGDFWGIEKVAPSMNDNKGTSLVLLRTEKGKQVFDAVSGNMKLKEVSYEEGVKQNVAEYRSVEKPSQRDAFFPDMMNMSFSDLASKYAAPIKLSPKIKIKRMIKKVLNRIAFFGGGADNLTSITEYYLCFTFQRDDLMK